MKEEVIANRKFETARLLFEQGLIKEFKDLFEVVPYSVVAKKLNTNNVRFKAKLEQPMLLRLGEIEYIAAILGIDSVALFSLISKGPNAQESVRLKQNGS